MHDQLFETLKKDHQEVKAIFKKMLETKGSSQREELLDQLYSEIMPHMRAEERVLYPMLSQHCSDCKEDSLESMEEHHAARLVLHELQELSSEDERFRAKTMVLHEMVEHHIKEEESTIFKDIRKSFNEQQAGDLLDRFNSEKEKIKKRLH